MPPSESATGLAAPYVKSLEMHNLSRRLAIAAVMALAWRAIAADMAAASGPEAPKAQSGKPAERYEGRKRELRKQRAEQQKQESQQAGQQAGKAN
ncbi:hypothetical protein [Cupriavidus sp. IDO]|uniref:hypothetical protein n=1 Tax=Cupriavidus sp. IDO TaxID=1539142 RepID=UPI000578FEDD|nr:hypothetical protein [Cupriavidus sp. IDO]KWR85478.1 hypothetical protein RM96_27580 [Cupriavidus sp. IDO]